MNIRAKFLQPRHKLLLVVTGSLIGALNAWAQSTPAPASSSTTTPPAEDDETVVLSPFEVDASNDIGYYAENTLAGSRINTNVGDLASSITVVTKQQLEDTGSLGINDVFLYEANTEGAGTYTPFIMNRSIVRDGIGGYAGDDGTSNGIATANRVRGLGSADTAQNNYPTLARMAFDSYNTNSVEINRGPNSMLFGTGSPAGIVNQSTSEAVIGQRALSVSARFGSFGAQRFNIGVNVPLGEHLAVYAAVLRDEKGFQRKPSHDEYDREYISVTFKPTRNTKITASYENYANRNNRPNYISPSDYVSPWLQAGRPGWNPATQVITFADGRTTRPYLQTTLDPRYNTSIPLAARAPVGDGALTDTLSPFFVGGIQFIGGRSTLRIDEGEILNFWVPNATNGSSTPSLPAVTSRTAAQHLLAAARYTTSRSFLSFSPPASTGATEYGRWTEVSVTDPSIYDWEKYNVQGGNYGEQEGNTANIEFQQQITPSLFFSAGWFHQELEEWTHYGLGQANQAARLYVDTNTHHLDGTPNPYFGSPYVFDSQLDSFYTPETNDNLRGMLAYKFDFTKSDKWTRHLGRHQILGLVSKQEVWRNNLRYRMSFEAPGDARFLPTPASLVAAAGGRSSWAGNAANIQRIYYLGQNNSATVERGVDYVESPGHGGPTTANLRHVNWLGTPQGFAETPMQFDQNLFYAGGNYGVSTRTIDSYSVAWQGHLWNERIIPTVGWRRDQLALQSYNGRSANGQSLTNEQFYANGEGVEGLWNNQGAPLLVDGDTTTRGVVFRPFKGWSSIENNAQNGNFLSGLLSGLSLHFNKSDNFNPPPGIQVDFFDRPLPKPSGDGKDYGIGVSMFENKLVMRLNWYESNNKNAPAGAASTVIGRTQRIDTTSARRWAEYVVRIRSGQDPRTEEFFHNNTVNPLSAAQQQQISDLVWGNFELGTYDWPQFDGTIAGTESNTSKGMEFQMIYNPKRNWNIKLTIGQQEASYSDAIGELQDWIDFRKPQWQALNVSGVVASSGFDFSQTYTRFNGNRLFLGNFWNGFGYTQDAAFNDAPSNALGGTGSAASTYASIVEPDFYTLSANQDTKVPNLREWSANLLSNYAFQEGRLKGFSVGGSIRWQDEATAAYYGELDPTRYSHPAGTPGPAYPAGTIRSAIVFPDLNRPIMTPAELNVDLWLSYTRRIFNDKSKVKIQVNVRDVTESGGLQTVSFNLDGSPAQRRIKDPRQFFVTTTFDF